jgi:hypothetical protein
MSDSKIIKPSLLDKLDKIPVGFVTGIIVPVITFIAYYKTLYSSFEFNDFLTHIRTRHTAAAFIKVSVFGNLPLFLIFNMLKRFLVCYGIFIASILYILLIFYLKFLS